MKLLLSIFFSLLAFCTYSQQTLGFNRVILVGSVQDVVPSGKVWKLEGVAGPSTSAYGISTSSGPAVAADHLIEINGLEVAVANTVAAGTGAGYGGTSYYPRSWASKEIATSFPLWLPEGTTLRAASNVHYISVIEFIIQQP